MLTPDERRGAVLLVVILLTGAGWDLWRVAHPPSAPSVVEAVPTERDVGSPEAGATSLDSTRTSPGGTSQAETLDLNRASAAELDALPGIGPVLAARIVEQRRRMGPFHDVDELRAVRGVGPRLLERLRGRVRVGAAR